MSGLDGPGATMNYRTPALDWMRELRERMHSGQRPTSVTSPLGEHQISYHEDDFFDEFALVGLHLPDEICADMHGTYGPLTSLRIYYNGQT